MCIKELESDEQNSERAVPDPSHSHLCGYDWFQDGTQSQHEAHVLWTVFWTLHVCALDCPHTRMFNNKGPQPPTEVSVLGFLAESQLLSVTLKKLQYKRSQCRQGRGGIARTAEVLSQTCSETGQGIVLGLPVAPSQALG